MEVNDIVFEPFEGLPIAFKEIYEFKSYLGSGGFGDVFEVVRKSSGTRMALKVSNFD
jgi:serine/threonine protein kinase